MNDNRDSVIIYSGGLDSTTLLYEEQQRIALAVTFDYGSNHAAREMACARHHCSLLGIEHLVIELGFMGRYFASSLLSGADAIPSGNYDEENMKSTVVPFRNGIMLSIACGLAESRGLTRVLIANHGGDHAIYPPHQGRPRAARRSDGYRLRSHLLLLSRRRASLRHMWHMHRTPRSLPTGRHPRPNSV